MSEITIENMEQERQLKPTIVEPHIVDGVVDIEALRADINTGINDDDLRKMRFFRASYTDEVERAKHLYPDEGRYEWERHADEVVCSRYREHELQVRTGDAIKRSIYEADSIDSVLLLVRLFVEKRGFQWTDHLYYAQFSPPDFRQFFSEFSEKLDTAQAAEFGERIGKLFMSVKSTYGWRFRARMITTIAAKNELGISDKESFNKMIQDPSVEARMHEEGAVKDLSFYSYLKAIGYHEIRDVNPVRHLYDRLMATGRVVKEEDFRSEIIQDLENEELYEDFTDRFTANDLLAAGLEIFSTAMEYAAPFSQNAQAIAGLIKRQKQSKDFSYTGLIKLANQLGTSLNNSGELPEGLELPNLDSASISDLPIAITRLQYVATQTGDHQFQADHHDGINECMELSKVLTAAGAQKKAEERPMSIGDVVLEFPGRSADELQEIIEQLEAGVDINDVHEKYRMHNQRTGGRAFWHKFQPGYGIIS